jgi:hypothetical protein
MFWTASDGAATFMIFQEMLEQVHQDRKIVKHVAQSTKSTSE